MGAGYLITFMLAPFPMVKRSANRLIKESSPYLLQHAHNPVDWHPWNESTLAKARSLDKMLLISIGYAACHWCHVMERESFTDEEVARIMNRYFVCVKVDREERPDVDHVYMSAVQLITGGGGWPLNCFALPDGKPFFGGTYFRKEQWMQLLENVHLLFVSRRKELEEQAAALTRGVLTHDLVSPPSEDRTIEQQDVEDLVTTLKARFDNKHGGMTGSPKFPMPVILSFLLHYHYYNKDKEVEDFLKATLRSMAFGGIYDQVGGGFARYSTDSHWKVPHFEKMLYDNAQLVSVYSRAWMTWKDPLYQETVQDTLGFILREMTDASGGFYSSLDADSEGVEGRYYTWETEEFKQILEAHADLLARYYQVGEKGMWEKGRNILLRERSAEKFAQQVGLQPSQFKNMLRSARARLMKERQKRIPPALDNKVLTSWNGMMLKGFTDAYQAFQEKKYLHAASRNAAFLLDHMMQDDGKLYHSWREGKASVNGFLEDYSFMAEGLLSLYQLTFDQHYLEKALRLAAYTLAHFFDQHTGLFCMTSSLDPPLIARKSEVYDNVIPSSNASMARVLFQLGLAFEREDLSAASARMVKAMQDQVTRFPSAYSQWASVMLDQFYPYHTLVITGPEALEKTKKLARTHHAGLFFCGSVDGEAGLPILENRFIEGETMMFLCTGKECRLPTSSVEDIFRYLGH